MYYPLHDPHVIALHERAEEFGALARKLKAADARIRITIPDESCRLAALRLEIAELRSLDDLENLLCRALSITWDVQHPSTGGPPPEVHAWRGCFHAIYPPVTAAAPGRSTDFCDLAKALGKSDVERYIDFGMPDGADPAAVTIEIDRLKSLEELEIVLRQLVAFVLQFKFGLGSPPSVAVVRPPRHTKENP